MSKFLIELPEREEIGDLVGLMADFIDAKYRFTTTLETDDERLARAVAGLTGQILTPDDWIEQVKMPNLRGMPVMTSTEIPANTVILASSSDGGRAVAAVVEEPKKRTLGKTCTICGDPAAFRSTICSKDACKVERQRRYDAAWKAKKANSSQLSAVSSEAEQEADEPQGKKEEQPAASPFFSPWTSFRLLDKTGTQMVILDYHSLLTQIWDGILLTGALVQDVSSEKYYEVRGEALEAVSAEAVDLRRVAAGRGAMEETPAAD